ncbi:MAG: hypothetical protein FGM32_04505 [Candidatus Kapabacteria bacterium]|nr:hypothetical protein [Candidatus Kapabacteria bacterium]
MTAQPTQGIRDFVPNGSFEQISIDHQKVLAPGSPQPVWPAWDVRYLFVSQWWRQFHRYMLDNSTAPPNIISYEQDRVPYITPGTFYDPVSCSSSDLFTSEQELCNPAIGGGSYAGIPENWFGYEPARDRTDGTNKRYAGIYYRLNGVEELPTGQLQVVPLAEVNNPATDLWREYLEVELLDPLEQGKKYTLSYHASLAEVSTHAIRLEARVSPNPYLTVQQNQWLDACNDIYDNDGPTAKVGIPYTTGDPGISLVSGANIVQKVGWKEITHEFVAKGGERYLTIGNFELQPSVKSSPPVAPVCQNYYSTPTATEIAYYYIDDVRLTRVIDCFCKENDQAFDMQLVPVASSDPTKCCFNVRMVNGGRGKEGVDRLTNACTIFGVDISRTEGQNILNNVFSWESRDSGAGNPTQEPLVGDNQWRDLGTVCLPAFDVQTTKEFVYQVKGQDGSVFCEQRILLSGCKDECDCKAFTAAVRVEPNRDSTAGCCFDVFVDASKLRSGCVIGSVDVYTDATNQSKLTDTYKPAKAVAPSFSGLLYSFCIDPTAILTQNVEFVFRDTVGNIICRKSAKLTCTCNCRTLPPKLELQFTNVGRCCFDLQLSSKTSCDFQLNDLKIQIGDAVTFNPVSKWLMSKGSSSVSIAPVSGSVSGNTTIRLGELCVPACFAFDPRALVVSAAVNVGGVACSVDVDVAADAKAVCRSSLPCSDVIVTLVKPVGSSSPAVDACCYRARIQIRNCPSRNDGLIMDVTGPGGVSLRTMNLGGGIFESAPLCRSYHNGEIFTVKIRNFDGTIYCEKKIPVPTCSTRETNE